MKYWIPLLRLNGDQIIFSGQALPLPIDKRVVQSLQIAKISEGFKNTKLGGELALFCKIKKQTYILGINKIFTTPSLIRGEVVLRNSENLSNLSGQAQNPHKAPRRVEQENMLNFWEESASSLKKDILNLMMKKSKESAWQESEERNFHWLKEYLDGDAYKMTEMKHRGVKIKLSGRINGVNMAKSVETRWGQIKPQSYNQLDYVQKDVRTPWGIFGLRVYLN